MSLPRFDITWTRMIKKTIVCVDIDAALRIARNTEAGVEGLKLHSIFRLDPPQIAADEAQSEPKPE